MVDAAERLAAAILLSAIAPLLLALALAIYLCSGRAPWIAHRRVGQRGSELWVLKLRTMWDKRRSFAGLRSLFTIEYVDDETGPGLKGPCDCRVTSTLARFCRRHSLDELPQLVQVVSGRMLLVGPRPVTAAELATLYGCDAAEILRVKPGLTGLWQVSGRNRLSGAERRALDLQLVRNSSARCYCKILARTVPEILGGKNSW
ncbi:MAG: sugar transferase [Acidobacteriia bacterium]|nr:sugar transferase [Terriglobia bacterium]